MRLFSVGVAAILLAGAGYWLARGPSGPEVAGSAGAAPGTVVDFRYTDIDGKDGWLSRLHGPEAIVVVMRDSGCPVSQRYGHEIRRIEAEYAQRAVAFLYLNVNGAETESSIREEIERFGLAGTYVHDPEGRIGAWLAARSTGEVFLLDGDRRVLYRGAIDDQYGIGWTKPEPRHTFLRDALEAHLAGQPIEEPIADAPGCVLGFEQPARAGRAVTFHADVLPIVQANCQDCHRRDGMAPFALETYDQVHTRRHIIAYMVREGRMPPWGAHRDVGRFANDRSLSETDLYRLVSWVENGAPEGNRRHAPKRRRFDDNGWGIGQPDLVLAMPQPFEVPAEGIVDYQYFRVETGFTEDRWIQALELRPGSRQHVHHALVFIDDREVQSDDWETGFSGGGPFPSNGGLTGFFAGYAPGTEGIVYPARTAKRIPAGTSLIFQMHYTTNGQVGLDLTELGLVFADGPPEAEVFTRSAFNTRFLIPPGAADYEVTGVHRFAESGRILSFFPHMHVRGSRFLYEMLHEDGSAERLLWVPRYDFNWQIGYILDEPLQVAAGARLRATAWFDNSRRNQYNPDPNAEVRFGEQTNDEMMIGYFDWVADPSPSTAVMTVR
jgi:mono/diheme cytochrome c family protein